MYGKLTNKIVHNQLTHYINIASCMGRVSLMRDALQQLIEPLRINQSESVLFFPRDDSRYFIVEFDGVRLMTVYEGRETELVVEAIDQLPESGALLIIEMLNKAIQIKTLEWHVQSLERFTDLHQRTTTQISNLSATLLGKPAI